MTTLLLLVQIAAMPDARYLTQQALTYGVDPRVVLAIAWEETRGNIDPRVRGAAHEIGRFQLSPATARRACPGLRVEQYHQNVKCFFLVFIPLMVRYDLPGLLPANAIKRYNGRGPKADAYTRRVLKTVREL